MLAELATRWESEAERVEWPDDLPREGARLPRSLPIDATRGLAGQAARRRLRPARDGVGARLTDEGRVTLNGSPMTTTHFAELLGRRPSGGNPTHDGLALGQLAVAPQGCKHTTTGLIADPKPQIAVARGVRRQHQALAQLGRRLADSAADNLAEWNTATLILGRCATKASSSGVPRA